MRRHLVDRRAGDDHLAGHVSFQWVADARVRCGECEALMTETVFVIADGQARCPEHYLLWRALFDELDTL